MEWSMFQFILAERMRPSRSVPCFTHLERCAKDVAGVGFLLLGVTSARACVAYSSINIFDTVNDTGVTCHGFEIEMDDIHSADITYTYGWRLILPASSTLKTPSHTRRNDEDNRSHGLKT